MIIDFNDDWLYREDGVDNTPVTLPHDGMISGRRDDRGVHGLGWFHGGDVEYTKRFDRPNDDNFFLEFEGVYKDADVFVNGKHAAFHAYGYTGFTVDITDFLESGENTVAVHVHNSDQPNSRWYTGTGIYRPVRLYALPSAFIYPNGVRIKTLSIDPARVQITVKTRGAGELSVSAVRGECVACERAAVGEGDNVTSVVLKIADPALWSADDPQLYTCRVTFGEDSRESSFGIRTVSVDRQNGFTINGQRTVLRGACIHHDNGILGARCYAESEWRKIALLKSVGYNVIRSAHNPCSKAMLKACDALGMMVLDEYADMWYVHKTKHDYASYLEQNYAADIAAMIDKDYSHPSVVMYSLGNEVAESGTARGVALLKDMISAVKKEDDRPVTVGINPFFNYLYSVGLGQYSDKKASKPQGKKVGSEFYNALVGKFGAAFMKTMAKLRGCDRRTNGAYSLCDVAGYNYGIKRYARDLKKYGDRVILGTETFCADAYDFWKTAKSDPAVIGDFVWAGMDYLGEVGIGAWEYRDYAPQPSTRFGWISAGSGRLDLAGNMLGEALYTRVVFGMSDMHIAVSPRPVGQKHSPSAWKYSNALPYWCGEVGKKYRVEIYTRAHTVELMLNGKTLDRRRTKKCCAVFNVEYSPGELLAVGYSQSGQKLHSAALTSPTGERRLHVHAESKHTQDSIYYIDIFYGDDSGACDTTALGEVKVTVDGGKLLAVGNACPYNTQGFSGESTRTYYGRALAAVECYGAATVTVTDGERSCSVEIGGVKNCAND